MILRKPKYLKNYFKSQRLSTCLSVRDEKQRFDFNRPELIPLDYWKNVIWIAVDLKKKVQENNKQCLNYLNNKHVTLLFGRPHGRFQLAFTLACYLLGARNTLYFEPNFERLPNPADSGKVLSTMSDMLVVHGLPHGTSAGLSSNIDIPFFSASCNIYCLQKALSDLMTFQEKFKKIKGLTLAWVGPPTSMFNTYLLLCPKFGMSLHYLCICAYGSGKMSPVNKPMNKSKVKFGNEVKEFKTVVQTIEKCDIIATSMHPDPKNQVTLEVLKAANQNWAFMHTLPRGMIEVTDDVFSHQNNISWLTSENYLYIAMAIILMSIQNYKPSINVPDFDGEG